MVNEDDSMFPASGFEKCIICGSATPRYGAVIQEAKTDWGVFTVTCHKACFSKETAPVVAERLTKKAHEAKPK